MRKTVIEQLLRCPVCGAGMTDDGHSLRCGGERVHCFDISAAGYVNLAPSSQSGGGDSKTLVAARTAFLASGAYGKFCDAVCNILKREVTGGVVIDAGCGEGYYSLAAARATGGSVCGFDLSKAAVTSAAKAAGREGIDASFFVGGIFDLPLRDGCADAVINLFAPCAPQEFFRVLRPSGILLVACAGEHHLEGLKGVLYDNVILNKPRADLPQDIKPIYTENVRYDIKVDSPELIEALFSMTPYYYRTSPERAERLRSLNSLETTVEFDIFVYRKGRNV